MSTDPVMDAMKAMASEGTAGGPDLRAEGLVKIYGDRTVVNRMSMDVSCGEIVGLLGPNGAGKTTTFYMEGRLSSAARISRACLYTCAPGMALAISRKSLAYSGS